MQSMISVKASLNGVTAVTIILSIEKDIQIFSSSSRAINCISISTKNFPYFYPFFVILLLRTKILQFFFFFFHCLNRNIC